MLEIALDRPPKLACIARLFNALHENAIRYCSLKGNERHLKASVSGESDIDVLFDQTQKDALESTIKSLGFKEFVAIKPKRFRDVVDFLALDAESGLVV
ncbi:MAG TPA: hypothetical protein VFO54_00785, partial [Chryseosolibacter sp.]|nr:hypothetical protein [Chryseosolibacter sp.]